MLQSNIFLMLRLSTDPCWPLHWCRMSPIVGKVPYNIFKTPSAGRTSIQLALGSIGLGPEFNRSNTFQLLLKNKTNNKKHFLLLALLVQTKHHNSTALKKYRFISVLFPSIPFFQVPKAALKQKQTYSTNGMVQRC